MDELLRRKIEYEVASGAYHDIAHRNAQQALKGTGPSPEDLASESDARQALFEARQAYLAALSAPAKN